MLLALFIAVISLRNACIVLFPPTHIYIYIYIYIYI